MKTDFKTVMTPSMFYGEDVIINYTKSTNAILTLGFKADKKCNVDVKFFVFANGSLVAERDATMTHHEGFVKIPFSLSDNEAVTIQAMNCCDVTDIEITYKSIEM